MKLIREPYKTDTSFVAPCPYGVYSHIHVPYTRPTLLTFYVPYWYPTLYVPVNYMRLMWQVTGQCLLACSKGPKLWNTGWIC